MSTRVAEVRVEPRWPVRLPRRGGRDGVTRTWRDVHERLLHVDSCPVRVRAWHSTAGGIRIRAEAIDPDTVTDVVACGDRRAAGPAELKLAIERMRFAFSLDDDMGGFFRAFSRDPLLGPVIHRKPWVRPRRRPWPWEALAWAITEQLIESSRAAEIQRRLVYRWGPRARVGSRSLRDVPSPEMTAGRAPAEIASMDLTEARALALVRCAREVAAGRADLSDAASDARLLRIREIGPWTVQSVGLRGRGDPDSLPAGDLAYVKLVGHLAGLGRRATVEEVEEFYAPYEPYRGLAGSFSLSGYHGAVGAGPPARAAA
jgi:3-methyladenine DNA glycosylase/8-oxoguanine DNA glycosylase